MTDNNEEYLKYSNCGKELYLIDGCIKYEGKYINQWLECPNVPSENMFGCASMYKINVIEFADGFEHEVGDEILR